MGHWGWAVPLAELRDENDGTFRQVWSSDLWFLLEPWVTTPTETPSTRGRGSRLERAAWVTGRVTGSSWRSQREWENSMFPPCAWQRNQRGCSWQLWSLTVREQQCWPRLDGRASGGTTDSPQTQVDQGQCRDEMRKPTSQETFLGRLRWRTDVLPSPLWTPQEWDATPQRRTTEI